MYLILWQEDEEDSENEEDGEKGKFDVLDQEFAFSMIIKRTK